MTLSDQEILSKIDHTLLKPTSKVGDIDVLCAEAVKYGTASVCIPPYFVTYVNKLYPDLNICTVIGFPLGYNTTDVKLREVEIALNDGANELDMVINLSDVKNGFFDRVLEEIKQIKDLVGVKILKVIIETCYLSEAEKVKLCQIVTEAGADYIKTSTGFGTGGATFEDIELFSKHIGPNVKMKAAGGVKSKGDLIKFIELGCERIGTSSGVKLVLGEQSESGY
jgi:deoxyribose-phosphate aldolase